MMIPVFVNTLHEKRQENRTEESRGVRIMSFMLKTVIIELIKFLFKFNFNQNLKVWLQMFISKGVFLLHTANTG